VRTLERLKQELSPNGVKAKPNPGICIYCANSQSEACKERCEEEGKYRYLVPATLENWECFREVVFTNVVDMDPATRLAFIYLMAHYAGEGKLIL
jgi:hypothetical protein